MLNLPDVTLISIDTTDNLSGTLNGVYTSMSGINFGAVKMITTKEQIENNSYLVDDGIILEEPFNEIKNCLNADGLFLSRILFIEIVGISLLFPSSSPFCFFSYV